MENTRITYRFCRLLCRYAAILTLKVRYYGLHNVNKKGPAILVSNHQSFFDPPLVGLSLPREACFMARDSLFHNPLFGKLITHLNAFPVRRGKADIGAVKEALRRLKRGELLVLFPEGTRSMDGKIQPLLPGFVGIAKKSKAPIIPTLIDGAFQVWPRSRLLPQTGDVVVEYGRPIMPNEYADMTVEELMDRIRNRMLAIQSRWHTKIPHRRLEWFASGNESAIE